MLLPIGYSRPCGVTARARGARAALLRGLTRRLLLSLRPRPRHRPATC